MTRDRDKTKNKAWPLFNSLFAGYFNGSGYKARGGQSFRGNYIKEKKYKGTHIHPDWLGGKD